MYYTYIPKKNIFRLLSYLLAAAMFFTLLPAAALADDQNGAEANPNIIQINREYGVGKLETLTISGADISDVTADEPTSVKGYPEYTYNVTLNPGTEIDTVLTVTFGVTGRTKSYPGVAPICQEISPGINIKKVLTDVYSATIASLSDETSIAAYIYPDASSIRSSGSPAACYVVKFTVAPYTDGPAESDVKSITIVTPPAKTVYYKGECFNPAGMTLQAHLKDGSDSEPFHECSWSPTGKLTSSDNSVTISYAGKAAAQPIQVKAANEMVDAVIRDGDGYFIYKPYLLDENAYEVIGANGSEKGIGKIIAPYGATDVHVDIMLPDNSVQVFIGEDQQQTENCKCTLTLPSLPGYYNREHADQEGATTVVTLKKDGEAPKDYKFVCYSQIFPDLPDKVVDYLSIASQYTNGGNLINPNVGINAVATLLGQADSTAPYLQSAPYSLGNFGGYVTYYYKNAITDDPKNPYGIDFIVRGNSVDATDQFAEPGNVLVSEDGVKWYTLAGSLHYDDNAIWNYSMTYINNGTCGYSDSLGNSGSIAYAYPKEARYPLFPWTQELEKQMTLTGVLLTTAEGSYEYVRGNPPFPDFGYADVGSDGDGNTASNPYTGTFYSNTRTRNEKPDGFDLKWAVDENGQPVEFPNGIHYIKVQTATCIDAGAIGEKSTEVNMVRVAAPADNAVGKTSAPSSVTIDGNKVSLEDGKYVYDVPVHNSFGVDVMVPDDANVYINGTRASSLGFAKIPDHGMLRVIVQEGEKEPVIYYFNLTDDGIVTAEWTTTVTMDGNGGDILGKGSIKRCYNTDMIGTTLPVPTRDGYTFLGWYSGQKVYTSVTADMPAALSLTAQWKSASSGDKPTGTVNVSFRLIGATLAKKDVDLSVPADDSEYVTWISTRSYTMPEGDTVYDLFTKALGNAGITALGQDSNYVTTIYAPTVCGGYELSEMTNGPRSGWMYTVNGRHPLFGLQQQELTDGDKIIFHYVNDYAWEVEDWADLGGSGWPQQSTEDHNYWNKWLEAADVNPTTSSVSGQPDKSTDKTALKPVVRATGGKAAASISSSDLSDVIKNVGKNGGSEIVIAPEITGTATKVTVDVPKNSISSIVSDTSAGLTVQTSVGNMTIPHNVLSSVASQASGDTVTVSLDTVDGNTLTSDQQKAVGSGTVYDVSILSGGDKITSFGGGNITISLPYTLKSGENASGVAVWYMNDSGELQQMTASYDKTTGLVTFTTPHLSYYVVGYTPDWVNPFTDVNPSDWFYDAVKYASQKNLMSGTSSTNFEPNADMTRAMLVTVLYRIEGEPAVTGTNGFTDVENGQWYTDAVTWASTKQIISGYGGGRFGTNDSVTREQIVAILYNYAKAKEYDVTKTADLNSYMDAGSIDSWACDAMKWAVEESLITGTTSTTLDPAGTASRAQVATVLTRFDETITDTKLNSVSIDTSKQTTVTVQSGTTGAKTSITDSQKTSALIDIFNQADYSFVPDDGSSSRGWTWRITMSQDDKTVLDYIFNSGMTSDDPVGRYVLDEASEAKALDIIQGIS